MWPLTYLYDGHMVYGYSFLVDLDILNPLVRSIFSFGQLQERCGLSGFLQQIFPRKIKIKRSADDGEFS